MLNELIRLGIVLEKDGNILLQKGQFIPDPSLQEARKILVKTTIPFGCRFS